MRENVKNKNKNKKNAFFIIVLKECKTVFQARFFFSCFFQQTLCWFFFETVGLQHKETCINRFPVLTPNLPFWQFFCLFCFATCMEKLRSFSLYSLLHLLFITDLNSEDVIGLRLDDTEKLYMVSLHIPLYFCVFWWVYSFQMFIQKDGIVHLIYRFVSPCKSLCAISALSFYLCIFFCFTVFLKYVFLSVSTKTSFWLHWRLSLCKCICSEWLWLHACMNQEYLGCVPALWGLCEALWARLLVSDCIFPIGCFCLTKTQSDSGFLKMQCHFWYSIKKI